MALQPRDCPRSLGHAASSAIPPHLPEGSSEERLITREADDIANLAFIGGKTNRAISDKSPAVYFPPLITKVWHAFAAQCIPTASTLLQGRDIQGVSRAAAGYDC